MMKKDNIRKVPVKKNKRIKKHKSKMDTHLLIIVLILSIIGVVMVLSASTPLNLGNDESPYYYFERHVIYLLISLLIMSITMRINFNIYKKLSPIIYIASYILCLLVFSSLGSSALGASRWIKLGPVTVMPSDFLKIGTILLFATIIYNNQKKMGSFIKGILPLILLIGFTILPIYKQPDYSTLIVLGVIMLGMMFFGGMKISTLLILGSIAVAVGIKGIISEPYRLKRLISVLNPMEYKQDESWQLVNALYGVASGGFLGTGIGRGVAKQAYLSNQAHNDWIFSVIAEETGFLGSAIIIILYLVMVIRGFKIALECDDLFGKLVAAGITLSLGIQGFINVGVAIGIVPSTGITLPFISYGGSALISSYIMIGILLNISMKNNEKKWIYRRNDE